MKKLSLILFLFSLTNLFSMEELETLATQEFPFEALALELQSQVLFFTCCNTNTLFEALKFITNLKQINKHFFELINQKYIAKKFIKYLYRRFRKQIKENISGFDRLILFQIIGIQNPESQKNNFSQQEEPEEKEINQAGVFEALDSIELKLQNVSRDKRKTLSKTLGTAFIASQLCTLGAKEILLNAIKNQKKFISDFFIILCAQPALEKNWHKADLILIKNLVDQSIDVNYANTDGVTGLMKAATIGNVNIVELLLDNKADPNIQNTKSGYTALMKAIENWISLLSYTEEEEPHLKTKSQNFKTIIKLLLKAGADPNRENTKKLNAQILAELYKKGSSSSEQKGDFSETIKEAFKKSVSK